MRIMISMAALLAVVAGCAGPPTISTGTLGKAGYTIASPAKWNGDLVILARGYAPADAPLSSEVDVEAAPYKQLLGDGWIVAATSYRRKGIVIRDGSEDVELLRRHIAQRFGPPRRTFVIGWSMGGAVATIIAETGGKDYHGVLAICPSLGLRDRTNPYVMTYGPKVPLLFLTNQNEMEHSSAYIRRVKALAKPVAISIVRRDGHCNVNGAEIGRALEILVECDRTGKLTGHKEITIATTGPPSVATFRRGRAYSKVTGLGKSFGNIYAGFVRADMERLGIKPGSHFLVGKADKSFKVFYGKQFSDVPRGKWVAFITADSILLIARNFANAAETLPCKKGDEIYIAPQ